jgi:WD40 repeat protein
MPDGHKLTSYPTKQYPMNPGTGFAATSDLRLAAYGLPGGRIGVMDLHIGKELWTAVASTEYTTGLEFSPDGKTLASAAGFADSDIRLWNVATGQQTGRLEGHGSWVSSLVFWPDGKKLASSSADQTIRIWDIASQKCLDVLRGHRQEVWRLAFLPDAKTLVSGAKDGTVCFWDTSVTHPRQPHLNIPIPENVLNWCFTPDSRSVLTISQQGQVSQWTGSDFQQEAPLPQIGETTSSARVTAYQFSPDGRLLAAGSTNGVLQIWDLARRARGRQWTNTTSGVAPVGFFAGGSKLLTYSGCDNLLHVWDLQTGLETQSWQAPAQFNTAALTPDEGSCLALGYGGDVVFRNLADQSQKQVELDALEAVAAGYSPDGKRFAVASDLGYARVWDAATWRQVANLGGFLNGAHTVSFSPDGKRLAIASDNKEAVKLWDTDGWQDVFTLEGQGTGFQGASFSPDGNTLAWGSQNALYLWRAPSWDEIHAAEAKEKADAPNP